MVVVVAVGVEVGVVGVEELDSRWVHTMVDIFEPVGVVVGAS